MPQFLHSATKDMSFHLACLPSKTFSHRQGFSWRGFGESLGTWCLMVACMLGYLGQADRLTALGVLALDGLVRGLIPKSQTVWDGQCSHRAFREAMSTSSATL